MTNELVEDAAAPTPVDAAFARTLFHGMDKAKSMLDPSEFNALEESISFATDKQSEWAVTANHAMLSSVYNLPYEQVAEQYEELKADYARQKFKLDEEFVDDSKFFSLAQQAYDYEDLQISESKAAIPDLIDALARDRNKEQALAELKAKGAGKPMYAPDKIDVWNVGMGNIYDKLAEMRTQYQPQIDLLRNYIESGASPDGLVITETGAKKHPAFAAIADVQDMTARNFIISQATQKYRGESKEQGLIKRADIGMAREVQRLLGPLTYAIGGEEALNDGERQVYSMFKKSFESKTDPLDTESFWGNAFVDAASMIPYMATSAMPGGIAVVWNSAQYEMRDSLINEYGVDPESAKVAGYVGGLAYTALDRFESKLFFGLGEAGKMSNIRQIVRQGAVAAARQFAKRTATLAGKELVVENLQDALTPLASDTVNLINGETDQIVPSRYWDLIADPQKQLRLLAFVGMVASIASGAATTRDASFAAGLLKNQDLLLAAGYTQGQVDQILNAKTPDEAVTLTRALWSEKSPKEMAAEDLAAMQEAQDRLDAQIQERFAMFGDYVPQGTRAGTLTPIDASLEAQKRHPEAAALYNKDLKDSGVFVEIRKADGTIVPAVVSGFYDETMGGAAEILEWNGTDFFSQTAQPGDRIITPYQRDGGRVSQQGPRDAYRINRVDGIFAVSTKDGEFIGEAGTPEAASELAMKHALAQENISVFDEAIRADNAAFALRQSLRGLDALNEQLRSQEEAQAKTEVRATDFDKAKAELTSAELKAAIQENILNTESLIFADTTTPEEIQLLKLETEGFAAKKERGKLTKKIEAQKAASEYVKRGIIAGSRFEEWADEVLEQWSKRQPRGFDMKSKRGAADMSASVDAPRLFAAATVKGAALIERGVTDFAQWTTEMAKEFGAYAEKYANELFAAAQDFAKRTPIEPTPEDVEKSIAKTEAVANKAMKQAGPEAVARNSNSPFNPPPTSKKKFFSKWNETFRNEGFQKSPYGVEAASRFNRTVTVENMIWGESMRAMDLARKELTRRDSNWIKKHGADAYQENGVNGAPNERIRAYFTAWNKVETKLAKRAVDAGVMVADDSVEGGMRPFEPVENYIPHQLTDDARKAIMDRSGPLYEALSRHSLAVGMSQDELNALPDDASVIKRNGHLEYARTTGIPEFVEVDGKQVRIRQNNMFDLVESHIANASKRLAVIENWGDGEQTGQFSAQSVINELAEGLGKGNWLVEQDRLLEAWDEYNGNQARRNKQIIESWGNYVKIPVQLMAASRIPQLSMSSLIQVSAGWVPIAQRFGLTEMMKSIGGVIGSAAGLSPRSDAELNLAYRLGAVSKHVMKHDYTVSDLQGFIGSATETMLKMNQSIFVNRNLNKIAALAGAHQLGDYIAFLRKPNDSFLGWVVGRSESEVRQTLKDNFDFSEDDINRMVESGIDYKDLIAIDNLAKTSTEFRQPLEDIAQAAQRATAKTNLFRESVLQRPGWMSNVVARSVFAYTAPLRMLGNGMAVALDAAKRGNVAPLARLLVGGAAAGAATEWLRNFINREDGEPAKDAIDWIERFILWELEAGTLGMWGYFGEEVYWSMKIKGEPSIPAPLASFWFENVVGVKKAVGDRDAKIAYKTFAKTTPVVRAIDAQLKGPAWRARQRNKRKRRKEAGLIREAYNWLEDLAPEDEESE